MAHGLVVVAFESTMMTPPRAGGVEKRMSMIMIQGEPSVVASGLTSFRAELWH
jgi:hypothetical protein